MAMHLPVDHPLNRVYRVGGALVGVLLVALGVLAYLANRDDLTARSAADVVGLLHGNGVLGIILGVVGLVALLGAVVGGNLASAVNLAVGALLMLIGLIGLCLIRSPINVIGIDVPMVIALFVIGIVAAACGLYGRVSGGRLTSGATTSERPFREEF